MSALVVIGVPSLLLLLLVLVVVSVVRSSRGPHEIIDEMSDPTPQQKAKWAREDEAWNQKHNDEAAWWNP
jgi:hypothetical protein